MFLKAKPITLDPVKWAEMKSNSEFIESMAKKGFSIHNIEMVDTIMLKRNLHNLLNFNNKTTKYIKHMFSGNINADKSTEEKSIHLFCFYVSHAKGGLAHEMAKIFVAYLIQEGMSRLEIKKTLDFPYFLSGSIIQLVRARRDLSLTNFFDEYITLCASCGKENVLSFCNNCREVGYCSKACQTADWLPTHKNWCKLLKQAPARMTIFLNSIFAAESALGDRLCSSPASLASISVATPPSTIGAPLLAAEPAPFPSVLCSISIPQAPIADNFDGITRENKKGGIISLETNIRIEKDKSYKVLTFINYNLLPGRVWGKTRVFYQIKIQAKWEWSLLPIYISSSYLSESAAKEGHEEICDRIKFETFLSYQFEDRSTG